MAVPTLAVGSKFATIAGDEEDVAIVEVVKRINGRVLLQSDSDIRGWWRAAEIEALIAEASEPLCLHRLP